MNRREFTKLVGVTMAAVPALGLVKPQKKPFCYTVETKREGSRLSVRYASPWGDVTPWQIYGDPKIYIGRSEELHRRLT